MRISRFIWIPWSNQPCDAHQWGSCLLLETHLAVSVDWLSWCTLQTGNMPSCTHTEIYSFTGGSTRLELQQMQRQLLLVKSQSCKWEHFTLHLSFHTALPDGSYSVRNQTENLHKVLVWTLNYGNKGNLVGSQSIVGGCWSQSKLIIILWRDHKV
jgi:hypothetical protein